MSRHKNLAILFLLLFLLQQVVCASIILTDEERSYIATRGPVRAASVDGSGPIQYTDSHGVIRGISVQVLKEIGIRTGLSFDYMLYAKLGEADAAFSDGTDILFGIPDQYARPGYKLSSPFLRSQTILFANKRVKSQELENKRFAATRSSALPEGISEEQAIYYSSREDAIKAVNKGEADFGYGNAYSVAFYTLQHGLQDIYTIPHRKEDRYYRILFIKDDPLLISIIEKGLASITPSELQAITLDATSHVERIITPSQILDSYGEEILLAALVIIAILVAALFTIQKSRVTLSIERKKFRTIAEVSNEYLFEYEAHDKTLILYEKFKNLFTSPKALQAAQKKILSQLTTQSSIEENPVIELEIPCGKNSFFRISASKVSGYKGKDTTWIGKLQDITEEVEKQNLLKELAQKDGLTGLLNATTTRLRIEQRLQDKDPSETDFCIIFDLDDFKTINDSNGHLAGNKVLKAVGSILLQQYNSNPKIVGRIGGDEFCAYLVAIASKETALSYCNTLLESIRFKLRTEGVTISLGLSQVRVNDTYETLFARVDDALYQAKSKGKNRIEIAGSETHSSYDKGAVRTT